MEKSTAGDTDRSFSTTDMPKALTCTGITGGVSAWLAAWPSFTKIYVPTLQGCEIFEPPGLFLVVEGLKTLGGFR